VSTHALSIKKKSDKSSIEQSAEQKYNRTSKLPCNKNKKQKKKYTTTQKEAKNLMQKKVNINTSSVSCARKKGFFARLKNTGEP
jgi:hypothetical protein